MSRRAKLSALAIGAAATVILALASCSDREPSYQGQPLSYWIRPLLDTNAPYGRPSALQLRTATDAVRHIGTNAIPLLVEWVSYDAEGRRSRIRRLPKPLHRLGLVEALYVDPYKELRAVEAAMALISLGPDAAPAFPQLGRLLTQGYLFGAGTSALAILREIGEPAVPTLAAAMTNKPSDMRLIIAMNLGIMGPKAHAAVPALESLLQDPQPGLRNTCIQAIESITGKPSTNIPPSQVGP